MLYLTIFTYDPSKRNEVMRRRLEKGALIPDGMKVVGDWTALGGGAVYRVVEVETPEVALAAARAWSDLGRMEIVPVMETADALRHTPTLH
jgi:hypothetical protein